MKKIKFTLIVMGITFMQACQDENISPKFKNGEPVTVVNGTETGNGLQGVDTGNGLNGVETGNGLR